MKWVSSFRKNDPAFQKDYHFIKKKELGNYVNSSAYQAGILSKLRFSFNPLGFLNGLKNEIEAKSSKFIMSGRVWSVFRKVMIVVK